MATPRALSVEQLGAAKRASAMAARSRRLEATPPEHSTGRPGQRFFAASVVRRTAEATVSRANRAISAAGFPPSARAFTLFSMPDIIEEQAAAYIQDKAAGLGISCRVAVEADGAGDWPVPTAVTVTGALTAEQRETLTRTIEADFAVPAERQTYESGGGG